MICHFTIVSFSILVCEINLTGELMVGGKAEDGKILKTMDCSSVYMSRAWTRLLLSSPFISTAAQRERLSGVSACSEHTAIIIIIISPERTSWKVNKETWKCSR